MKVGLNGGAAGRGAGGTLGSRQDRLEQTAAGILQLSQEPNVGAAARDEGRALARP